jgi:predicted unusual protein kinase regulating ubiquinone biosynthesis (AarF/ABC1/UbiB family)
VFYPKGRRREIELRLSTFGLRRGPHRLGRGVVGFEQSHIRRVRAAVEGLGPVFSSFGLYMGTRFDLLPEGDCHELGCIPDQTKPSSTTSIRNLIKAELGCWPEEVYRIFEEKPFASGLLYQQHLALLNDGQPVTVKLLRPEIEEFLQCDLDLLALLKGVFVQEAWADTNIENAIDDFSLALRSRIDFVQQASIAETLTSETGVFRMLKVPFVYRQLSTSKLLTVERLPGENLADLIRSQDGANGGHAGGRVDLTDLTHRLCVAWLHQALLGKDFPAEASPKEITILPNRQIAVTDGTFASLSISEKANLWNYLTAVVTEDPDRACFCLIKETVKGKNALSESELQQRFRQIVPFRDHDWTSNRGDNDLIARVIAQWRLASKSGYSFRPAASSFFRSLVAVTAIAQQLVTDGDILHQAFQDVRLIAGVERCREMLSTQQIGEQMDRYLAITMDLPQNLDRLLTTASEVGARPGLQVSNTVRRAGTQDSVSLPVLVLAMLGIVLLSHRLASLAGPWGSEISALTFVLLGAIVLRASTRRQ